MNECLFVVCMQIFGGENMCGILGVVGEGDQPPHRLAEKALATMEHRGPDAGSTWQDGPVWLGHRRLSILDLSASSNQPFVDAESGCVIVFNGEIYNYRELRDELVSMGHVFRSKGDTEVLLAGYKFWGKRVVERCNGMFAFAIWDPRKHQLFMARDRFGVKPFYYALRNQRLFFASEPKALHVLDPDLTEVDVSSIIDFIADSTAHAGSRTFYRNIAALPPAHYCVYDLNTRRLQETRYWDYPQAGSIMLTSSYDDQFASLLHDAVHIRRRSDVPIGLTLSGGLDSSAILAATVDGETNGIKCYTSTYSEPAQSELSWAKIAANAGNATVEAVDSDVSDWIGVLKKTTHHMDAPGYSPAVLPLWGLMAKARADNVPVLLEGQGADELLGGYPQYASVEALSDLHRGEIAKFTARFNYMRQTFGLPWTSAWMARSLMPSLFKVAVRNRRLKMFAPEAVLSWRSRGDDPALSKAGEEYDPLHKLLWQDHSVRVLPALLHYGDTISMAHSVESRLPFMDYRLVEWIFGAGPPLLENGETKTLVRSYLKRQNFHAIAARQDKKGYSVPMSDWYSRFGEKYLSEMLSESANPIWDIVDRKYVSKLVAHGGSARKLFHQYKLVTLGIWLDNLKERSIHKI